MKIINQLVVQSDMPNDNNVVWVYGNTAKYYNNGTWTTLGESNEDRKELEEKVDSLDKEMGEVKKDLSILGSKQDVVELEIGDSNEIKANNLKNFNLFKLMTILSLQILIMDMVLLLGFLLQEVQHLL